mgnify:CR=1 FL=1
MSIRRRRFKLGILKKARNAAGHLRGAIVVVQKANAIFRPIAVTVFPEYFIVCPANGFGAVNPGSTVISPTFRCEIPPETVILPRLYCKPMLIASDPSETENNEVEVAPVPGSLA